MIDLTVIIIYTLALLVIFIYSLSQLQLLLNYLKAAKVTDTAEKFDFSKDQLPPVTIQLPLYNEYYVIERLLQNIARINYPKSKLEIQVLDDSTDHSVQKTAEIIRELQDTGLDIQHIRRENRVGFKAGALKEGLKIAKGDYVAVFDSDFVPGKNWLMQTLPYFKNPKIGVVQTRWGHLNRDYSLLTRIQAFALDFHFILEQTGRNFGKNFINFNGTAGIWRKECILDAGNWSGDTLTEDLDLSYRAQMKKWDFKYLEDVETPAELPVVISAARSQQFRWNKGAAENFRKNYGKLLQDPSISWSTKFHGFFHLLNSSMFLVVLLLAVLSVPVLFIKNNNPDFSSYFNVLAGFAVSSLIFFACYYVAYRRIHGGGARSFFKFVGMFFTFFSVAMGFSVHNSLAVLEGHFGKKSEFIRTPKFNINSLTDSWKGNRYLKNHISGNLVIEALLFLYFGFAIFSAFRLNEFGLLIFHLMLFAGFGFVVFKSLKAEV
ncbi:glycosyltransferase family 2 protein [Gramella sp. GC03-9]|uniref:Glycosyltransferase family 2 protein n=1 Tax=Christiangramia oceanisediminis TaxID=2920386 RepID=A0A9X2KVN2_9FLAO|nr:cellulose synthase family protein [Gramella oceanisediminis]MCP9198885.1 glycosyltransferase family 2 protein [Gramella oceanisediminis]